MELLDMPIGKLKPYAKNPRDNRDAVKYVAESIKQFGFKVPLVIDHDNVVVCGHTRLLAAKRLQLTKVPCIVADDLTDEQIKAFRLADNKVAEKAEWDFGLLSDELGDILNLDMADFGFDIDIDFGAETTEEQEEDHAEHTQERVENILNLGIAQYEGVGKYDIPPLDPIYQEEVGEIKEWIGFNYVLSDEGPEGKAVHFFIDDYQFERLWNNPEKYVEKLRQYALVLTPDFSPYGDMPLATQIFNHYRKHWVGRYLQLRGVKIAPTIRASTDERSFEWYLDGEPEGGIVCISNMWTNDEESKAYFMREYQQMKKKLKPEKIFVYGSEMPELKGVEVIPSFSEKRFKSDGEK